MGTSELIITSGVSGGFAGIICDVTLYPIDTVKTRLQSKVGFLKSGGFRGIYRGIGSCALGSIPNASAFFIAYDTSKLLLLPKFISSDVTVHILAGAIGEVSASLCKMPFEVVKQTAQAGGNFNSRTALAYVIRNNGLIGLYSGFFSTIYRDVPYTAMQMPIWEYLKGIISRYYKRDATAFESGVCGCIAAGISSAVTTPLDVAKTRIILSQKTELDYTENPFRIIWRIYRHEGVFRLFSGIVPRVIWISTGGFIFFWAYDFAKIRCNNYFASRHV